MLGRDGLLCQKGADYASHSICKADFTIEEVTAKEDYSHNTYRYHRYQNLSVQPIWHEDSSEDQIAQGEHPELPIVSMPIHFSNKQQQPSIVSFQEFKCSNLIIHQATSNNISSEFSPFLEKFSQPQTLSSGTPQKESQSVPSRRRARTKKTKLKKCLNQPKMLQFEEEILKESVNKPEQYLPSESLSILIEGKNQSYQDLLQHMTLLVQGKTTRKILLLTGEKQTGKKTLLNHCLREMRNTQKIEVKDYFVNLEKGEKYNKQFFCNLFEYLLRCNKEDQTEEHFRLFIFNNLQQFIYTLKRSALLHQFKSIVAREDRLAFIFVDRLKPNAQKNQWLFEKSKTIEVSSNSLDFMASSLVAYLNNYPWARVKWTINRPLAMYFCSKLSEQVRLDLGLLTSLRSFLAEFQTRPQQSSNQSHISRGILEKFKESFLPIFVRVTIDQLNIHEKITLIAIYACLKRHQQILVQANDLENWYRWGCQSLSLEPKTSKQFHRTILTQLETYKLVRVLKKGMNERQGSILLNMELEHIRQNFSEDFSLCKFFEEERGIS